MAAIQQQQQLQRQLLAQQLLLQNSAASGQTALQANRKQREVYVGNLAIGSVTADMLKELFNAVLAQMVQDPISNPPVMETKLDASGESENRWHPATCFSMSSLVKYLWTKLDV